jgi:uncharacterized protein (DUF58 family)
MKMRLVLIIVPLVTLALALAGGFTLLWRFFLFMVVVLLLSYLWTRLSIGSIDSQVKKSAACCQVGGCFEEEFAVINRGRIPTPLIEVQEATDLPGYQNAIAFGLSSRGSHRWRTSIYCQHRGQYSLGVLNTRVADPLGFFPRHRQLGEPQNVIVYPEILELPFFQVLPPKEPGLGLRRLLSSEIGPNAARVREYASGDSLRHIHWHTTAHTGRLMVKDYDPDRSHHAFKNIWIIPDMHEASQMGEGNETTEEYSMKVAASLAKKYIDSGKKVGLIASGDQSYLFLPEGGDQHLQPILQALALMKATGPVPIDTLLTSEAGRFDTDSAVIVITPSDNQGIAAPLRRMVNRGTIVIAILLDAISFGGITSRANAARSLISSGLNVYVIRRGLGIARALDSRMAFSHIQYIGDKV